MDEWTDWVLKVVWRKDKSGSIQIWKNGEEVLQWQGLQTGSAIDEFCPFLKIGRYSSAFKYSGTQGTAHRSYIDAVRVGFSKSVTYEDVAPGGDSIGPRAPATLRIE
jgi:hypothetical protein